jgi:hypothetical protein
VHLVESMDSCKTRSLSTNINRCQRAASPSSLPLASFTLLELPNRIQKTEERETESKRGVERERRKRVERNWDRGGGGRLTQGKHRSGLGGGWDEAPALSFRRRAAAGGPNGAGLISDSSGGSISV